MKYTSSNVQQLKRKGKPWLARIKFKDPTSGKWKETTKILHDVNGKREAKRAAEAWRAEMNAAANNSPNMGEDKTVGEVVLNYLDYQLSTGLIERSTYSKEMTAYNNYINGYVANYSFSLLDRDAINLWLTKLNKKGYSQGTIFSGFKIVRKVYNYYYNIGELPKNPFAGIKAPKTKVRTTRLTSGQMDDLLEAVYIELKPEDFLYPTILLAFYGALRIGEICGLKWNNIDFKSNSISVENAIGMVKGEGYTKQPKNTYSIRSFPMIPQLRAALEEVKKAKKPKEQDFVNGSGTEFTTPIKANKAFRKFVRQYDLKDAYGKPITFHGLRHNFGFMGVKSGMDIASLSRIFGHANRATTLNIYSDSSPDALKVAAAKIGNEFNNDTEYFKTEEMNIEKKK